MEWKELQIDNLPPDILTGDYEFEYTGNLIKWKESGVYTVLRACQSGHTFRYRKPEPKQPTHEEIMTKWWLSSSLWVKVMSYDRDEKKYETPSDYEYYDWFIGRESADIPPEE